MIQEVFKRYEKKYLLTKEQYRGLMNRLGEKIVLDEYGEHTICNIYFDTPDYELIRTSIEKPVYKEKLRLRSYGIPKKGDTVFIELKKKFDGVVYKRRTPLTLIEAEQYLYAGKKPKKQGQILNELDYFLKKYIIKPTIYLAYDRMAYYVQEDINLRITFDKNIRCRKEQLYLELGSAGEAILPKDHVLMEVKIPGVMPLWLSRIFSELCIYPVSFSKYGTYYEKNALKLMEHYIGQGEMIFIQGGHAYA